LAPPLRPLPYREVKRRLEAAGFAVYAQKGSHMKFVREEPDGLRVVIVPVHREMAVGTLRSVLRQAGLTPEEFEVLWLKTVERRPKGFSEAREVSEKVLQERYAPRTQTLTHTHDRIARSEPTLPNGCPVAFSSCVK
jgi:predicted RNA binding protein YcfA (HicA-like mRNA interferase family)